jgi:hypothetical protein
MYQILKATNKTKNSHLSAQITALWSKMSTSKIITLYQMIKRRAIDHQD